MRRLCIVLASIVLLPVPVHVQQRDSYDYWRFQRDMIQRGQQAIMMCNGLFTSNRTLEQIFAQELKYLQSPIGTAAGGDYEIDRQRRAVDGGGALLELPGEGVLGHRSSSGVRSRSAASARLVWDFTVPTEIPSRSAVSASDSCS